jgi:myo-inositol-1(or 4)-monophosphatase
VTDPAAHRLEVARQVAVEAGEVLLGFAARLREGEDLGVASKTTTTDPVSEADRAAERLIASSLLAAFPDDGLLGEEGQAPTGGSSGRRWVVDPLDGTVNFLYGQPSWCVSIACEDEDGWLVGVVHQPTSGETFAARRGHGAWLGDAPLTVSDPDRLAATLVATGFAYDPQVRAAQGAQVAALLPVVRDIRRGGSAALDLAWCAAGRVDGYLEFGLQPWDWAAGSLLVREAGGVVTHVERVLGGVAGPLLIAGSQRTNDRLTDWLETMP